MTWKLESAIKDVSAALETLRADAAEDAKEALLDNPRQVIKYLFEEATIGLSISVAGIDWNVESSDEPLTVYIQDLEGDGTLYKIDPIGDMIDMYTPRSFVEGEGMVHDTTVRTEWSEGERKAINRALVALQSGINRIKAYEAEREQAQP